MSELARAVRRRLSLAAGGKVEALAAIGDVDMDGIAVNDVTGQQLLGQLVTDGLLNGAAQRAGTVGRVIAAIREPGLGLSLIHI